MVGNLSSCVAKDEESLCLPGSSTTHTILKNQKYFSHLKLAKASVKTIFDASDLIKSSENANIVLTNGTRLIISDAMFSNISKRNL